MRLLVREPFRPEAADTEIKRDSRTLRKYLMIRNGELARCKSAQTAES